MTRLKVAASRQTYPARLYAPSEKIAVSSKYRNDAVTDLQDRRSRPSRLRGWLQECVNQGECAQAVKKSVECYRREQTSGTLR